MTKATWLAQNGYFYIMHRFYEYDEILNWMRRMKDCKDLLPFISISVGIKKRDVEMLKTIVDEKLRLDFVTVDVAHGDHEEAIDMLKYLNTIKQTILPDLFIIGGNIATPSAFFRMAPYVRRCKGRNCLWSFLHYLQ
jgi:GMP reductase